MPFAISKQQSSIIKSIKTVSRKTAKQRINFVQSILILCIFIFAVLAVLAKQNQLMSIDLPITMTIQSIPFASFSWLMWLISQLGYLPWAIILVIGAIMIDLVLKRYYDAILIGWVSVTAAIISEIIKIVVNRPRPDANLIQQIGQYTRQDSFPSGHVMFEVGFFGILWFLIYTHLAKHVIYRNVLLIILSIPILLVGLSRIYLGAHWFSDVVSAYLLISVWLYICIKLYRWLIQR